MASFTIPKGKDYAFTVSVIERDSFLAQDLTNMNAAVVKIFDKVTEGCVITDTLTIPVDALLEAEIPAIPAAQQVDTVTVAVVSNETVYSISVDGTYYSYTSDIDATASEISAGLVAAMVISKVSAVDGLGTVVLTGPSDYSAVTYAVSNNMYITNDVEATEGEDLVPAVYEQNAFNGKLECTIPAVDAINGGTSDLLVTRGTAEDNYYLKPGYQGTIDISFTDDTLPINVLIEKIYVSPTGGDC